MGNCEAMTSSTHSFACSRNVSWKIAKLYNFISSLFLIRFSSNFPCSAWILLFYLLKMNWIYPLIQRHLPVTFLWDSAVMSSPFSLAFFMACAASGQPEILLWSADVPLTCPDPSHDGVGQLEGNKKKKKKKKKKSFEGCGLLAKERWMLVTLAAIIIFPQVRNTFWYPLLKGNSKQFL